MKTIDYKSAIRNLLPEYKIGKHLYESSYSTIYEATDTENNKNVILKVLKPDPSNTDEIIRYKQEYKILSGLNIEGVIKTYGLKKGNDIIVLVLEDIGGFSLKEWIQKQKKARSASYPLQQYIRLSVQMTDILTKLHSEGIIHRNINPSNIIFNPDTNELKLIDFGVATELSREVSTLIKARAYEGTLEYISPEQTGRMNRGVDYRTDLYSLGITFYEMLTGKLPFKNDDAMALIHAHMAIKPEPVSKVNSNIPVVISDIIMKLLAKNAEDRYKSSYGVKADLEKCLNWCSNNEEILINKDKSFKLGQHDSSGQLYIPEKLYGRSQEISELLASFDRVAEGNRELILTSGYAGVGKSALIEEIHKPVTLKKGYFIRGKFDQYQQNIPYSAFIQAFSQYIELLLTEQESILLKWRKLILNALDGNGAVLTEMIPNLEKIIGPQSPVSKLGGQENRNRFNITIQNFVQTISTSGHPLVIFIDDMQWSDPASLDLLKILLTDKRIKHFLMIIAYRENEVDKTHPFSLVITDLKSSDVKLNTLHLDNLKSEDVQNLIQDSLEISPAKSKTLSDLIYTKTQGNAFFTQQLLHNLYEEGLLHFNFDSGKWIWDLEQIYALNITDNVVDLMVERINKLALETTFLFQLASCIGDEFDLSTLILLSKTDLTVVLSCVMEILREGLIIPLDEFYITEDTAPRARFKFLHDRVQHAAYSRMSDLEQQIVHLELGRLLLANTPEDEQEHLVFNVVQHYNKAIKLITDEKEKLHLATLNIRAADLAYTAAAFHSTQVYMEVALYLMPEDAWISQYDLMLKIHSQLAVIFSLTGNFEQLKNISQITEEHARHITDTVQVKQAKIQGLLAGGTYTEAIEIGFELIEDLGVSINKELSPEESFVFLKDTAEWTTEERIKKLINLPAASDETGYIFETAVLINGPVFNTNVHLSFVFVSQITKLCFEQGVASWTPVTISTFALLLAAALHDIPKARLLTDISNQLWKEKFPQDSLIPFMSVPSGGFIVHRYEHLKNTLPIFSQGMHKGIITGAFQFAGYDAWFYSWHHLLLGIPMSKTKEVNRQAMETIQKTKMMSFMNWCLLTEQVILNLQGNIKVPWILNSKIYNSEEKKNTAIQNKDFVELFRIIFYEAWLNYLFDRPSEAVKFMHEAETYLPFDSGLAITPMFYFYDAMAHAKLADTKPNTDHSDIIKRIDNDLIQLEAWVKYAPVNHQHRKDLIMAEKARLNHQNWETVTFYEKAIQGAKTNEYIHEEALAYERMADFYLNNDLKETAVFYLKKAHEGYMRWEAKAKVQDMEKKYPQWLVKPVSESIADNTPATTHELSSLLETGEQKEEWGNLDLNSILKTSQVISGHIILEELLKKIMEIVIENAGAQRGCLILEKEGNWRIEIEGSADKKDMISPQKKEIENSHIVCPSIIRYVIRSRESVILDNVSEQSLFVDDPYVKQKKLKSVLCMPLINHGELEGVLYLENNLSTNVFTPDRIKVLELLTGQVSIALENAKLYRKAQQEIIDRKQAEKKIKQLVNLQQTILDTVSVGIFYLKEQKIEWVNRAFNRVFGFDSSEALGQDISYLCATKDEYKKVKKDVYPFIKDGTVAPIEIMAKRKDNSAFWININGKAIDPENPLAGSIWMVQDITNRMLAELSLKKSEAILTATMESMNDGVLVATDEGKITHYNTQFSSIFSIPQDLLYTHDDQVLIDYAKNQLVDPGKFVQDIEKIYKTGEPTEDILQFTDGRIIERYSYPLSEKDPIKGRVWVFRDVTKQKETDEEIRKLNTELEARVTERTSQLEQVNKDLEAFAYSISHDLRAPLRHIDGFIELMYSNIESPAEPITEYYSKTKYASKRMSDMIDELLNFSRLGRKELIREPVDLNKITEEVIEEFKPDYLQRKIDWKIEKIPVINGDKALLKIVFQNLISNAVKYTSKVPKAIIEIGTSEILKKRLTIYVKDNGVGFDMNYYDKLFGVFQRLHSGQEFEGIGIGLANIKQIISKHKGTVRAESNVNKGATFYITLPVE